MSPACKKRKRGTGLSDRDPSKCDTKKDSYSLQDEIVNHLQFVKECGGLVVGFGAVLRGIRRGTLIAVISISRRSAPSMSHALGAMCRERPILLIRLQDIDLFLSGSSIAPSSAYGIKGSALTLEPKLSRLSERIHGALGFLRKSSGHKKEEEGIGHAEDEMSPREDDDPSAFNKVIHSRHGSSIRTKHIGKAEAFISLDVYSEEEGDHFPDYATDWGGLSISIRH